METDAIWPKFSEFFVCVGNFSAMHGMWSDPTGTADIVCFLFSCVNVHNETCSGLYHIQIISLLFCLVDFCCKRGTFEIDKGKIFRRQLHHGRQVFLAYNTFFTAMYGIFSTCRAGCHLRHFHSHWRLVCNLKAWEILLDFFNHATIWWCQLECQITCFCC